MTCSLRVYFWKLECSEVQLVTAYDQPKRALACLLHHTRKISSNSILFAYHQAQVPFILGVSSKDSCGKGDIVLKCWFSPATPAPHLPECSETLVSSQYLNSTKIIRHLVFNCFLESIRRRSGSLIAFEQKVLIAICWTC